MAVDPKYLNAVKTASQKYGVPADLLAAQIGAESGWNPNAKSPAGAIGISQFMPGTAKGFGIDPHNPLASIDAQGRMMKNLLTKYHGNVELALAGYNAGSGAVDRAGGKVPDIKETKDYIKRIEATRSRYPGLKLPSGKDSAFSVDPGSPVTAPKPLKGQGAAQPTTPFGLTVGGLLEAAKAHVGNTKAAQGQSFIEQAFQAHVNPLTAPLPSGAFSTVPVNKLKVSPSAQSDTKLSPSGKGIVDAALAFKGTPYSWGGGGLSGPTTGTAQGAKTKGFDCSALLQYSVYHATGKKIPRVASAQFAAAQPVPIANAKPGDAVFFGTVKNVHHVGIYIGEGKFIEAPHTGAVVRISNLADRNDVVGVGRF